MPDAPASELKPHRRLPDVDICRANHARFGDYADCLVPHPTDCRFALSFGDDYLCQHANRKEIIARTKP